MSDIMKTAKRLTAPQEILESKMLQAALLAEAGCLHVLHKMQVLEGFCGELVHLITAVANLIVQKVSIQWRRLWDGLELHKVFLWQGLFPRSTAQMSDPQQDSDSLPMSPFEFDHQILCFWACMMLAYG